MITHEEYMANSSALHEQYYLEIALDAGVRLSPNIIDRTALSQDPHLNDIPMQYWDFSAEHYKRKIAVELKKRGTFYSEVAGVCVMKAYARYAAAFTR